MEKRLLIAILEKGESFRMMRALREIGVPGGTVLSARTTGGKMVSHMKRIDVLTCYIDAYDSSIVFAVVNAQAKSLGYVLLAHAQRLEEQAKEEELVTDYQILEFIVERGQSDRLIKAAKVAGADNVVVVDGVGTALREDEIKLPSAVSSQKDVVFITVRNNLADKVAQEVVATGVLIGSGSGVGFRIPVEKYAILGQKR